MDPLLILIAMSPLIGAGMMFIVLYALAPSSARTLFKARWFAKGPLAIVADRFGRLRIYVARVEDNLLKVSKDLAFKTVPNAIYRLDSNQAILAYTGFGGAINLILPAWVQKFRESNEETISTNPHPKKFKDIMGKINPSDKEGIKAMEDIEVDIPETATVDLALITSLMLQNTPAELLPLYQAIVKARAKAGTIDFNKIMAFATIAMVLMFGLVLAIYIFNSMGGGGGGLPSIPIPGLVK